MSALDDRHKLKDVDSLNRRPDGHIHILASYLHAKMTQYNLTAHNRLKILWV